MVCFWFGHINVKDILEMWIGLVLGNAQPTSRIKLILWLFITIPKYSKT